LGTNIVGANFTLAGGVSTGGAGGGSVIIATANAGTSGSAQNAISNSVSFDGAGNIRAFKLHNNSTSQGNASNQDIRSGTYTPTLTNVTNVAASTAYVCQWLRVGNVVTVSGRVDIDPTLAVATELGLSLPVPSNLAAQEDLAGVAAGITAGDPVIAIRGDATNDRAAFVFTAVSVANQSRFFTFTYDVI
jgi:hypothetical protein